MHWRVAKKTEENRDSLIFFSFYLKAQETCFLRLYNNVDLKIKKNVIFLSLAFLLQAFSAHRLQMIYVGWDKTGTSAHKNKAVNLHSEKSEKGERKMWIVCSMWLPAEGNRQTTKYTLMFACIFHDLFHTSGEKFEIVCFSTNWYIFILLRFVCTRQVKLTPGTF